METTAKKVRETLYLIKRKDKPPKVSKKVRDEAKAIYGALLEYIKKSLEEDGKSHDEEDDSWWYEEIEVEYLFFIKKYELKAIYNTGYEQVYQLRYFSEKEILEITEQLKQLFNKEEGYEFEAYFGEYYNTPVLYLKINIK